MDNDDKKPFPIRFMHLPWKTWGIVYVFVLALMIILIIDSFNVPPIMGDLRGGLRMVVWPPDPGDTRETQLSVSYEWNVYFGSTPGTVRLSTQEAHTIEALITHWCQSTPSFRPLAEDEPLYDVALECGDRRKRFKVPVEQCPPVLAAFYE